MPIFMDVHNVPGVTPVQVAEAHLQDVKVQDNFFCKTMTYWLDEDKGCVFCLIEAPDKESVRQLHESAHGLIPSEIIPVSTEVVKAFLGRIHDPDGAISHPQTNLKVFSDAAFRILLLTRTLDTRLLQNTYGRERTQVMLLLYSTLVREEARKNGGNEVYCREDGFVISFPDHARAIDCAIAIRKKLKDIAALTGLRISLHGGLPVNKDEALFGSTIRFAQFLCNVSKAGEIIMSAVVRNLFKDNDWNLVIGPDNVRWLTASDEAFLQALADTLDAHWQNPDFDVPDFCRLMSLSKSQLYRKSMAMTDFSPNMLLREYRLLRSLELLRDERHNVSETTFDTGFSSPSYFTKCFQKRFGIQPLAYVKTRV